MSHPPEPIRITDIRDPRVWPYADLRDSKLREAERRGERPVFIAESEMVVRQLIEQGLSLTSVLVAPAQYERLAPVLPPGVTVYLAEPEVFREIVGFNYHRGVMACVQRPRDLTVAEVLERSSWLIVLEGLASQDNVGAIFRNAAGILGPGAGVILSPACCDPLYRKSVRVSSGHVTRVPFARSSAWLEDLARIRAAGFTLAGMTPRPGARVLREVPRPSKPAVLLGAEEPGLTEEALAASDLWVRVPMASGVDSLNVAVAGAIVFHQWGPARGGPARGGPVPS